jgi:hypothetical protein
LPESTKSYVFVEERYEAIRQCTLPADFLMVSTEFGILNGIAFCTQNISEVPRTDQLADAFLCLCIVFQEPNIEIEAQWQAWACHKLAG